MGPKQFLNNLPKFCSCFKNLNIYLIQLRDLFQCKHVIILFKLSFISKYSRTD